MTDLPYTFRISGFSDIEGRVSTSSFYGLLRNAVLAILLFILCLTPKLAFAASGWFPADAVRCQLDSGAPVNIGTIEGYLLKPYEYLGSFNGSCRSSAYRNPATMPTVQKPSSSNAIAEAAYCLTIQSDGPRADPRYLINTKDPNSKIAFNFFHLGDGSNVVISDGMTGRPLWARGQAGPSNIVTGAIPVPLDWNFVFKTYPGKAVAAGTYTNTFQVNLSYGAILEDPYPNMNSPSACTAFPKRGQISTITVTATVKESCSLGIDQHINFGRFSRLARKASGQGRISVLCTDNTKFQVGISSGLHSSSPQDRKMRIVETGGPETIDYNLYLDRGHSKLWTNEWNTDNVLHATGINRVQYFDIFAEILPQPLKPYGTYTDTVRIEVRLD